MPPTETTVWSVVATLTKYALEDDSDYHLVIADASGHTMIVEIPDPHCVGASSPFLAGIAAARASFDAMFKASTSFQQTNVRVQVTGVGFFDFLHGQTGVAPNGIELHPVLNVAFDSNPVVVVASVLVEYFNQALGHYFITADPNEMAVLDNGTLKGWTRTGQTFNVYRTASQAPLGVSPVCRFYGRPEAGLDSHFYSASPEECNAVLQKFSAAWELESFSVFYLYAPDAVTGACPSGTVPVYRLYNNRADVNHRYTVSPTIKQQMIDQGWIPEGYGSDAVGMCAAQ